MTLPHKDRLISPKCSRSPISPPPPLTTIALQPAFSLLHAFFDVNEPSVKMVRASSSFTLRISLLRSLPEKIITASPPDVVFPIKSCLITLSKISSPSVSISSSLQLDDEISDRSIFFYYYYFSHAGH